MKVNHMIKKWLALLLILTVSFSVRAVNSDSLYKEAINSSGSSSYFIWQELGDYFTESKNDSLEVIIHLLSHSDDEKLQVLGVKYQALRLYQLNKYDSAVSISHKGYELASTVQLNELAIDFEYIRGVSYVALQYYDNALNVADLAVSSSDSLDYLEGLVDANILLSNIALKQNRYSDANDFAQKAFRFATQLNDLYYQIRVHQLLANIQMVQSNYAAALENNLKALNFSSSLGNKSKEAEVLNSIGLAQQEMGKSKQAESYFLKSKSIKESLNDLNGVGNCFLQLGDLWVLSSPLRAEPYYKSAVGVFSQLEDQNLLADALKRISNSFFQAGNYKQALSYAKDALREYRQLENDLEISKTLMNAAYCYLRLEQSSKAIQNMKLALSRARTTNDLNQISSCLAGMGEVYEQSGSISDALLYKNELIRFNDSLYATQTENRVSALEERFKAQLKEQRLETLTKNAELKELRFRQRLLREAKSRIQLVFFASFLFLFLLMIYSSYRRLKLRKQVRINERVNKDLRKNLKAVVTSSESAKSAVTTHLDQGVERTLSGVKLGLEQLQNELGFGTPMLRKRYQQTIDYLKEVINNINEISYQILPSELDNSGIIKAIDKELERTLDHTRIEYTFEYFGFQSTERFEKEIEINVFRITQSLVSNIVKHSGASNAKVILLKDKNELVLKVEDNGIGVDIESVDNGLGLNDIGGRVAAISGILTFGKAQNTGLIVSLRIPLH